MEVNYGGAFLLMLAREGPRLLLVEVQRVTFRTSHHLLGKRHVQQLSGLGEYMGP